MVAVRMSQLPSSRLEPKLPCVALRFVLLALCSAVVDVAEAGRRGAFVSTSGSFSLGTQQGAGGGQRAAGRGNRAGNDEALAHTLIAEQLSDQIDEIDLVQEDVLPSHKIAFENHLDNAPRLGEPGLVDLELIQTEAAPPASTIPELSLKKLKWKPDTEFMCSSASTPEDSWLRLAPATDDIQHDKVCIEGKDSTGASFKDSDKPGHGGLGKYPNDLCVRTGGRNDDGTFKEVPPRFRLAKTEDEKGCLYTTIHSKRTFPMLAKDAAGMNEKAKTLKAECKDSTEDKPYWVGRIADNDEVKIPGSTMYPVLEPSGHSPYDCTAYAHHCDDTNSANNRNKETIGDLVSKACPATCHTCGTYDGFYIKAVVCKEKASMGSAGTASGSAGTASVLDEAKRVEDEANKVISNSGAHGDITRYGKLGERRLLTTENGKLGQEDMASSLYGSSYHRRRRSYSYGGSSYLSSLRRRRRRTPTPTSRPTPEPTGPTPTPTIKPTPAPTFSGQRYVFATNKKEESENCKHITSIAECESAARELSSYCCNSHSNGICSNPRYIKRSCIGGSECDHVPALGAGMICGGVVGTAPRHYELFESTAQSTAVPEDDGLMGSSSYPPGCYWDHLHKKLRFNADQSNTGNCARPYSTTKRGACLCFNPNAENPNPTPSPTLGTWESTLAGTNKETYEMKCAVRKLVYDVCKMGDTPGPNSCCVSTMSEDRKKDCDDGLLVAAGYAATMLV